LQTSIQSKEFESREDILMSFYGYESSLNSLSSSLHGLKSSFIAISNMLDLRISDLKADRAIYSGDIVQNGDGEKIVLDESGYLIKTVYEKIIKISSLLDDFLKRSKELASVKILSDFELYASRLKGEIDETLRFLKEKEKEKKAREVKRDEDRLERKTRLTQEKNRIEQNKKLLVDIKKFCEKNIIFANGLSKILKDLISALKNLRDRLTPTLSNKKSDFLRTQENINRLSSEGNKLHMKKSDLENHIYRTDLDKENIKEKVKDLSIKIFEDYNFSIDHIIKNYKSSEDPSLSREKIRTLKVELQKYRNINPNASIEYKRISERFDFLSDQKKDLKTTKKNLEKLITEIIKDRIFFRERFELINDNFKHYFKILFPLGEGKMILMNRDTGEENFGIDLKVDIGNNKLISLSLLSGGEKTLVSIAFLFAIFSASPLPFIFLTRLMLHLMIPTL
jgi:chromosome segregation protein